MERQSARGIINPAMIGTRILGLPAEAGRAITGVRGWFHAKLRCSLCMQLTHAGYARWRRQFAADDNRHERNFYRAMNEVPTLLMIGIILLAVLKPF
jgi:putative membrane protein